jgi:Peptidase A4 family
MRKHLDSAIHPDLVVQVEAELKQRVQLAPLPPSGFDPLKANEAELAEFALPARPDPQGDAELYAQWQEAMSPPLSFIEPVFAFDVSNGLNQRSATRGLPALGHTEGSNNWSGAYIKPAPRHRFVQVIGWWRVPEAAPPPGPAGGGAPPDGDFRSSTWVGLDGQKRHVGSSLPQLGTAQFVKVVGGQPQTSFTAWWQWWVRGQHFPPVTIDPKVFPVTAGDLIMASITVVAPDAVVFHLENRSLQPAVFVTIPVTAPTLTLPGGVVFPLTVAGGTAEWIVERPTDLVTDELYRLADYGRVGFHHCLARSRPAPQTRATVQRLIGARYIRMHEIREAPHRSAVVSAATRHSESAFGASYRRVTP